MTRVLIVGTGLVGAATAAALEREGVDVVAVSRSTGVDLEAPGGPELLRDAIHVEAPEVVVLAHGPTSPEWCHAHPEASTTIHGGAARVAAASGVRVVLVSSDVVFDGEAEAFRVQDRPRPVTAYGRAKVDAERRLANAREAAIVRVAMVYGCSRPGNSFAERILRTLSAGLPTEAPVDQFVSPVFVDDVADVVAAVAMRADSPRLVHLGGPARPSRYVFALEAAWQLGVPLDLVRPVTREGTVWALRPKHSSLVTSWLPGELRRRGLVAPPEGLRRTVQMAAAGANGS
jgi:dTDP-4-dehydrorhamnose reductase